MSQHGKGAAPVLVFMNLMSQHEVEPYRDMEECDLHPKYIQCRDMT